MSSPRRHHYCPQSYLASFTADLTRDGALWVFDRVKRENRNSTPKNSAHQRDFYRVDVDEGQDPFFLEKQLSPIEGGAKNAIDFILKEKKLPGVKEQEVLLGFIGLLAVRTPAYRKKVSDFYSGLSKMVLDIACGGEKAFEATKKRAMNQGHHDVADLTYEGMREFIEKGEYEIETPQNEQMTTMMSSGAAITECLLNRNWIVLLAKDGEFICSDNPVGLNWSTPPHPWRPPGFGLPGTEVTIPISKAVALLGIFEDPSTVSATLDRAGVACFNNKTIQHAERYVYGPSNDFIWRKENGAVASAQEYFAIHGLP